MIDNRKEQERNELHATIWKIANDLRGSVDGWDFKQYVLGILFYRFISENLVYYINSKEREAGEKDFDYRNLSDDKASVAKGETVEEKGFFILPSQLFSAIKSKADNNENLNEDLERVFKYIESSSKGSKSEDDIKGLFDDIDVNSNKLGATVSARNEKLTKLLKAIGDLNLNYGDNTIDLFGDAYEYLMTMYAANAGKSGGEFFTPQEVSELLAKITIIGKTKVKKVYDPACGSGSLLLKFAKVLGKENITDGFYGQEINITTYNLCRINMFLHDIGYDKFDIAHGDTLLNPQHKSDEPHEDNILFEAIVSNPPYSIKWEGKDNPLLINDERFTKAGILAPKSKADLAFVMHVLSCLALTGTAAIVSFPGVMYRGGAEQKIRKYLIDNNYIEAVIQLPADLFFGTSIQTCVLVLKKSKQDNSVLFIDGSKEFIRGSAKNKLSTNNINNIIELYTNRHQVDHASYVAPHSEIAEKDYNLSVGSYVEQEDTREVIDITELNSSIEKIVEKQSQLRKQIDEIVSDLEQGE